ncbi:hypothetical protein JKP88DRAFT_349018 [Tribonema minus]|uniref:Potassium channel tetramerisation-type BTB domain-containing protein n=1 Tax=Tribonema minus TaxID=303371 RepID=A0A836CD70_9STRA|nr:hypothetical protein JKP88DRAFT_349018 [Tribonema minus]
MEGEVAERQRPPAALAIDSTPILLNVGGVRYETMVGTLRLAGPGSFFAGALAHDRPFTVNAAGEYFIDRDGDMFQYVLSFLRTSTLNKVPDSFTNSQWRELQPPGRLFYCVTYQSRVTRQQDLAQTTPAVLRKFQWRPVGIRSGESVADALTHLLQLLCNGADVIDSPNDFEYSWAVSPICSPGRPPAALAIDSTTILLDVGGVRYETTVGTLRLAGPGSFFSGALAHDRPFTVNAAGEYFIDRDGDMFQYLLAYLRTGTLTKVPDSFTQRQWQQLQEEATYYGMDSLIEAVAAAHSPNLEPGQPMLQCARLSYSPPKELLHIADRDIETWDIDLQSGIVFVPSLMPGHLCYCVTYQVPDAFDRDRAPQYIDQGWAVAKARDEEDDASMNPINLLCNGSDVIDSPELYDYCWALRALSLNADGTVENPQRELKACKFKQFVCPYSTVKMDACPDACKGKCEATCYKACDNVKGRCGDPAKCDSTEKVADNVPDGVCVKPKDKCLIKKACDEIGGKCATTCDDAACKGMKGWGADKMCKEVSGPTCADKKKCCAPTMKPPAATVAPTKPIVKTCEAAGGKCGSVCNDADCMTLWGTSWDKTKQCSAHSEYTCTDKLKKCCMGAAPPAPPAPALATCVSSHGVCTDSCPSDKVMDCAGCTGTSKCCKLPKCTELAGHHCDKDCSFESPWDKLTVIANGWYALSSSQCSYQDHEGYCEDGLHCLKNHEANEQERNDWNHKNRDNTLVEAYNAATVELMYGPKETRTWSKRFNEFGNLVIWEFTDPLNKTYASDLVRQKSDIERQHWSRPVECGLAYPWPALTGSSLLSRLLGKGQINAGKRRFTFDIDAPQFTMEIISAWKFFGDTVKKIGEHYKANLTVEVQTFSTSSHPYTDTYRALERGEVDVVPLGQDGLTLYFDNTTNTTNNHNRFLISCPTYDMNSFASYLKHKYPDVHTLEDFPKGTRVCDPYYNRMDFYSDLVPTSPGDPVEFGNHTGDDMFCKATPEYFAAINVPCPGPPPCDLAIENTAVYELDKKRFGFIEIPQSFFPLRAVFPSDLKATGPAPAWPVVPATSVALTKCS